MLVREAQPDVAGTVKISIFVTTAAQLFVESGRAFLNLVTNSPH
jgi:hypothetical protein